jgi:hypothetical protein
MKTEQAIRGRAVRYWAKYQVHILFLVLVLDGLASIWASQKPECCDADVYLTESSDLKILGFIPPAGSAWLSEVHNYLYPTFLFLARSVGFTSRSSISVLQFALIVGACFIFSRRLFKIVSLSLFQLMGITLLIAFVPILAFSGYLLTESVASALLILWIGLWLELVLKESSNLQRYSLIFAGSFLTGIIWMTRPSLIWVPLTNIGCVLLWELVTHASWLSRVKSAMTSVVLMIAAVFLVAIPQYLITRGSRSFLNGVFHLDNWAADQGHSTIFRYITNISGCGPVQLIFSPYSQTVAGLNQAHQNGSIIYRIIGFVTRWCSGWDAVPTPMTYVYHLSVFPWIILSALAGLFITAPFFLVMPHGSMAGHVSKSMRYAEIGIFLMFLASQFAMGMTHGEFRYNVAGWIIAGLSMGLIPQHFNFHLPVKRYLTISMAVSFFVIVVGQLTLNYSQYWAACVK